MCSRRFASRIDLGVEPAPGRVARRHDRQAAAAVLDQAAAEPRQPRPARGLARPLVLHHGVVVHVGDRTGPSAGAGAWSGKCPTTIVWKCTMRCRPSAGCSRPESSRMRGVSIAPPATMTSLASIVCIAPPASMYSTPVARSPVGDDPAHVGLGHQLRPAGRHRLGQQRHRVALGVDGTAEEGAEAAVVAGGPAVVGDAVRRRRRLVGMQADLLGGRRREDGAVHRRTRRHRIRPRTPRGERVGPGPAGDADGPLHLGVERLELVVVEGPVLDGRVLLGPVGGEEPEVLLAETRHLAVGVRAAAANRRRDGVHLADVGVLALLRVAPERPRLDQRVGARGSSDR